MARFRLLALPELESMTGIVTYGALTCWWFNGHAGYQNSSGLPCDPRSGVLFQGDDVQDFIKAAKENVEHYGKHGLNAFRAAYHGVLEVFKAAPRGQMDEQGRVGSEAGKWLPTCFAKWDDYNRAIDLAPIGGEFTFGEPTI